MPTDKEFLVFALNFLQIWRALLIIVGCNNRIIFWRHRLRKDYSGAKYSRVHSMCRIDISVELMHMILSPASIYGTVDRYQPHNPNLISNRLSLKIFILFFTKYFTKIIWAQNLLVCLYQSSTYVGKNDDVAKNFGYFRWQQLTTMQEMEPTQNKEF